MEKEITKELKKTKEKLKNIALNEEEQSYYDTPSEVLDHQQEEKQKQKNKLKGFEKMLLIIKKIKEQKEEMAKQKILHEELEKKHINIFKMLNEELDNIKKI